MKSFQCTLFFSLLLTMTAYCCDPIFFPFCTAVDDYPEGSVFVGRITEQNQDGLQLDLIEVLRGDQSLTTVQVWDGTDIDCNGLFFMNTQQYGEPGDTVICLVETIDTIANSWEVLGDYRRPSSLNHGTFLRVTEGLVEQDRSFEQFVEDWYNGNCSTLVSASETPKHLAPIVYPNPCGAILIFENTTFQYQSYSIYDWSGRYLKGGPLKAETNTLDVTLLGNGLHVLKLEMENGSITTSAFIKD